MAFAIMIYHLLAWKVIQTDSSSLIGRFGIYGVSIFFVLSGLSMAIVYHHFIKDGKTSLIFFVRRIFRLWPLLWICVLFISLVNFIFKGELDIWKIFLNLTTLFGFIAPSEYINVGAWSIGNEVFYYALTPFFICAYNYSKILGNLIVAISIFIGVLFGFFILQEADLSIQWSTYINPLNNLFLYTSGIALYYNFSDINLKKYSYFFILIPLLIFGLYPVSGDQINIVTDINRVIFSFSAILIVLGFYKLDVKLPLLVSKPFSNLGEATYGIYLLHPIVYMVVSRFIDYPLFVILFTIVVTIAAANISYKVFEKPFIKIGKDVTNRFFLKSPNIVEN